MFAPHRSPLNELYATLATTSDGLTDADARQRLQTHGLNELRVRQDMPEFVKFLRQFRNFFALLLMIGGALALVAEAVDPDQGNLYIALALFGVVLLNAAFTYLQERQSERIMESFRRMLPTMATVFRDGAAREMEARYLVPGDVVLLAEGDRVPADGRLIEQTGLKVDLSSLNGESEPVQLDADAIHEVLLESRNMVFSGALVQSGDGSAVVTQTGMETQIGAIVSLTKATKAVETPIHRELNHFIRVISAIAIVLGVLFFLVSLAIGNPALASLVFAIGIIVANVPEGLLPTVTLSLSMASKRMAAKNALIKNLESVETLGSTTVICTDKTGTLTQNRLAVNTLAIDGRDCGVGDFERVDAHSLELAWKVMALCNNARLTAEGFLGDATEGALLLLARDIHPPERTSAYRRLAEQPFTSFSKHMITVHEKVDCSCDPASYDHCLKGAPEVVLDMCDSILRDGRAVPLDADQRAGVIEGYGRLARRGERGLALAWQSGDDAELRTGGYTFVALTGMRDPPRPEVPEALARCHTAGIRVVMLTGDYSVTAETIARQIGLVQGQPTIVQGEELTDIDDSALTTLLSGGEVIFARVSPAQKLRIVQTFQASGEIVTVTGDGVNDAPALKNADMGVAMGQRGTEVAKEAANMVLMDDNFATIVAAVEEGRTIFDNIKKFIAYILTSNIPEILPFIAFVLLDIPLPLTVVLILAIDLGTDILPALGLGAERAETDVMRRPPRARGERLLTRNLLFMSYGVVGMLQAAAGFFSYFVILFDGGWQWGQELAHDDPLYRTAVTGFFASIVICQVADVIICRTRRQSLFTVGLFSNRLVWLGIVTELGLLALISYVPVCNTFFGTAPLAPWQLVLSLPFALTILVGDELRRLLVRRDNRFVLRWLTW